MHELVAAIDAGGGEPGKGKAAHLRAAPRAPKGRVGGARRRSFRQTAPPRFFGTRRIWRDRTAVAVSDPSRTLVDLLDDPSIGGGMRHVATVVAAYFRSEHRNDQQLIAYTLRLGNRTIFKRLGYLVERLGIDAPAVVAGCLANPSTGYSVLDPAAPRRGRLLRRWRLLVNVGIPRP